MTPCAVADELGIGNTKPEGGSGSQAQIKQALKESELGLPVIVHQSFDRHPRVRLLNQSKATKILAFYVQKSTKHCTCTSLLSVAVEKTN